MRIVCTTVVLASIFALTYICTMATGQPPEGEQSHLQTESPVLTDRLSDSFSLHQAEWRKASDYNRYSVSARILEESLASDDTVPLSLTDYTVAALVQVRNSRARIRASQGQNAAQTTSPHPLLMSYFPSPVTVLSGYKMVSYDLAQKENGELIVRARFPVPHGVPPEVASTLDSRNRLVQHVIRLEEQFLLVVKYFYGDSDEALTPIQIQTLIRDKYSGELVGIVDQLL